LNTRKKPDNLDTASSPSSVEEASRRASETLVVGRYRTAAGSLVTISGAHARNYAIDFDWFEEEACIECHPSVDFESCRLVWDCDYCDGGSAELIPEGAVRPAGGTR
jgi:hypothetical protein